MQARRRYPWQLDGEVLAVETPEQTRLELRVASFGSRMVAALLDRLLVLAAIMVLALAWWLVGADLGGWLLAVVIVAYFLFAMFLMVVMELHMEGQTIGKRRLGLRTVMLSGRGLGVGAALVRNLARLVDELPLAWIVPGLVSGHRRIGDLLAGTVVITERHGRSPRPDWLSRLAPSHAELADRRFGFGAAAAAALTADDLDLLEYLGSRLAALGRARRGRMLAEIAGRYVDRLGLQEHSARVAEDPERFLQELGLFLRARFDEAAY